MQILSLRILLFFEKQQKQQQKQNTQTKNNMGACRTYKHVLFSFFIKNSFALLQKSQKTLWTMSTLLEQNNSPILSAALKMENWIDEC